MLDDLVILYEIKVMLQSKLISYVFIVDVSLSSRVTVLEALWQECSSKRIRRWWHSGFYICDLQYRQLAVSNIGLLTPCKDPVQYLE